MKNSIKWTLGITAALVVVAAIVFGNTRLQRGALTPLTTSAGAGCSTSWTKIFEGQYGPFTPSDSSFYVPMTGITPSNISTLRKLVKQGCDLKFQFLPQGQDRASPVAFLSDSVVCSAVEFFDEPLNAYVLCKFDPYFWIANVPTTENVLYGTIRLSTNGDEGGGGVDISKGYTAKDDRNFLNDESFFSTGGYAQNGNGITKVAIFAKK